MYKVQFCEFIVYRIYIYTWYLVYSVWTPSDCTLKSSSIFCTFLVDPKYVFVHVRRTPKIRGYSVFRFVTRLNELDCLIYISQNVIARLSHTIYIYIYPYFVGGVHFNLIYNLQLKPLFMRWTTSTALVIRNMRFVRQVCSPCANNRKPKLFGAIVCWLFRKYTRR